MEEFRVKPVAYAKNSRKLIEDDNWSEIVTEIILADGIEKEALTGIEEFSHLIIIFYMHLVKDEKAKIHLRHPRNDIDLPMAGSFAQRNKNRPNKLGVTTVNLIEKRDSSILIRNFDGIDGTPILDIKPVFKEFLAKGTIIQPEWTEQIMKNYWKK